MDFAYRPRGRKGNNMKVKQFLNKFLYASSSINNVTVIRRGCDEVRLIGCLIDPMNPEIIVNREELNSTVDSFRITGQKLVIYSH